MPGVLIENAVSLTDVSKACKLTLAALTEEIESLGLIIGSDWRAQPAVSVTDAAGLVDGSLRRDFDHGRGWSDYQAEQLQWSAARESTRRQAFDEAWKSAVRAGSNNGFATDKGHAAAREALEGTTGSIQSRCSASRSPGCGRWFARSK